MKPGGGKRKGANWERKVCEQLSRMIQPDSDETLFWRSAMSGGRSTNRHRQGKKDATQAGDITCIHPAGAWLTEYFFLECKHVRNLQIQLGLLEGRGALATFWRIAVKDARKHGKHPMLIAKENRCRTLVVMSGKGLKAFSTFNGKHGRMLLSSLELGASLLDYESMVES